MIIKPAEDLIW